MRQTPSVLFIAVDPFISGRAFAPGGFDEFTAALDHQAIPAVWLSGRSRLHLDAPRRKMGHTHPFIAEDGCGVYLPEDYFHLRPGASGKNKSETPTLRLGRFTCLPVAKRLPAAEQALETLSEETRVPVVTLHSLSPRELSQNTGLPLREAESMRQRDFDEIFFFAGASEPETDKLLVEGHKRGMAFRRREVLWSTAIGPNLGHCMKALSGLYERALRYHPRIIGVGLEASSAELLPVCDQTILLTDSDTGAEAPGASPGTGCFRIPIRSEQVWSRILEIASAKGKSGE